MYIYQEHPKCLLNLIMVMPCTISYPNLWAVQTFLGPLHHWRDKCSPHWCVGLFVFGYQAINPVVSNSFQSSNVPLILPCFDTVIIGFKSYSYTRPIDYCFVRNIAPPVITENSSILKLIMNNVKSIKQWWTPTPTPTPRHVLFTFDIALFIILITWFKSNTDFFFASMSSVHPPPPPL